MKKVLACVLLIIMSITLFACEPRQDTEPDFYLGEPFEGKYHTDFLISPLDDIISHSDITDVIKAKFIDVTFDESGDQWFFGFEMIENLRGSINKKIISVKDVIMESGYRDSDGRPVSSSHYQQGKSYLLLLCRSTGVNSSDEVNLYFVNQYLVIPLDDENKAYLKTGESFLWGVDIKKHIESQEILNAFENRRFEEYLLKKIKDNSIE